MSVEDLKEEEIISNPEQYQIYSRLRTTLQGSLLDNDPRKFIQNDGVGQYRVSTHPDFVTYNKERLLLLDAATIQGLAAKLPGDSGYAMA